MNNTFFHIHMKYFMSLSILYFFQFLLLLHRPINASYFLCSCFRNEKKLEIKIERERVRWWWKRWRLLSTFEPQLRHKKHHGKMPLLISHVRRFMAVDCWLKRKFELMLKNGRKEFFLFLYVNLKSRWMCVRVCVQMEL